MSTLQTELSTYASKMPELQKNEGKFVLIKGEKVEGIFDTYSDALKVGYERFKLESFLVKQIAAIERIAHFTRDIELECH